MYLKSKLEKINSKIQEDSLGNKAVIHSTWDPLGEKKTHPLIL